MAHYFRSPDGFRVTFVALILNVRLFEPCWVHCSGIYQSSTFTVNLGLEYFPLVYKENPG